MNPHYSASLVFISLYERHASTDLRNTIVLFRSDGFEAAFDRALEIGRSMEEEYKNGAGETVLVRLMRVESLDIVGKVGESDALEVYSESTTASVAYPFDSVFNPEKSEPTQTV